MKNFQKLNLIKSKVILFNIKQLALASIDSIYYDYFSNESYESFQENHLFHESVVMKCAAYRFASPEVTKELFSAAIRACEFNEEDYIFHPVFYLRISKPTINNALLDSQPHYDRSFGLFAYSFWLALEDASTDTGGLCFFEDSVESFFKVDWNEPNIYNYDKYMCNYKEIDALIKGMIIPPELDAGAAYMFDSNTLHGATKPKTAVRLSFDFRIAEKSSVSDLDLRSKTIFNTYKDGVALSNAKNLRLLGDFIGAERLQKKYLLSASLINNINAHTDISLPKNKLSWRTEYSWID